MESNNKGQTSQVMIAMKRKRTKRQRPHSPVPFSLASINSLNEEDEEEEEGGWVDPSPSSSYGYTDGCTEEEEDMANCLILLARGPSIVRDQSRKESLLADDHNINHGKITSKRFLESASNGDGGKVGYYVYECRTCNRTFPSFQALGGHRASHKKTKPNYVEEIKKINNNIQETDDGGEDERFRNKNNNNNNNNNSPFPLQLSYSNIRGMNSKGNSNNNNKVHECGICGAEFNSGQALGGHMRRHRGVVGTMNTVLSLSPMATVSENEPKKARKVLSLDLDLNLPAPEGDHNNMEIGFHFASKQEQQQQKQEEQQEEEEQQEQKQQQSLAFSSPALVNCQY